MARIWLTLCLVISTATAAEQKPVLSLVIDDLGYSLKKGMAVIDLEGRHTYAILPNAAYSQRLAQHAHSLNKEVILHLPMQSIQSGAAHEPDVLNESMDEDQLTASVHTLLDKIPFIRGVNNHMGSHLTEIDFFMRPVIDSIRGYNPNLYFLDSRTSPRSVAYTQAVHAGLSSISRDVFLDNEPNPESIQLQLNIWLAKAREHGSAIAIGHPYPPTIKVLQEYLPAADGEFSFMPVSALIEERKRRGFSADRQKQLTVLRRVQ